MRAPGGSFIWPKTSIVLSSTPDSFISSHRSLPSRERSPTPQNADRPPCSCARLWISSWMITVLPTPAPPNRPTLPPLAYGASRSITLIPVSNISVVGASDSTDGASRWIGQRSVSSGSSSPRSIRSPSTLKIRPSVARPTGTEIGAPVSITSTPRARPSVVSIATARTRSSPRCCCTSQHQVLLAGRGDVLVLLGLGGLGTPDHDRVVDLRQPVVEHRLDHDALDLLDPTDVALALGALRCALRSLRTCWVSPYPRPSAPATTSMISWVISAWRARFICKV